MADEILRLLRERDPDALAEHRTRHAEELKAAYARGDSFLDPPEYSFEGFSDFCLSYAASRVQSEDRLGGRLKTLLDHPDLALCVGILEGIDRTFEEARKRFGTALDEARVTCEEAFPKIRFPAQEFEAAVLTAASRRCLRKKFRLEEALGKRMTFPDFYLAAAALSKRPQIAQRAGDVFSKTYFPLAESYVRKRWSSVPEASDRVSALFFCALYEHTIAEKTGNPSKDETVRPPLLAEYRGQGPLAAWLTLALGNMVRDSIRTTKSTVSIDEETETGAEGSKRPKLVLTSRADQREGLDRSKCVEMLRSGLARAWETLKPREQLTLVMQTLMEVPPSLIARRVFHVHEGTITKYTTAALKKIKQGLETFAREEAKVEDREAEGCFEFMREAFPDTETLAGGIVQAASES